MVRNRTAPRWGEPAAVVAETALLLKKISVTPCWEREARDIHKRFIMGSGRVHRVGEARIVGKRGVAGGVWGRVRGGGCTISGQGLVDGVHSIEKTRG